MAGGWARRATVLLLALVAVVAPAPQAPAADRPEASFRWIRDLSSPAAAAVRAAAEATERGCDAVLFVFDVLSFAPPPGRSEFSANGNLTYDLPSWYAALDAAASDGTPVFAATSRSRRAVPVDGDWAETIRSELLAPWWDDRKFKAFAPAERWARRLGGPLPGRRPAIVLIASEMPPEDRPPRAAPWSASPDESRWRRKLLGRGAGFDPEHVGDAVKAMRGVFIAIAPEARFGDFMPVADVPQFPWVTRPRAMAQGNPLVPAITGDDTPPDRGGGAPRGPGGRGRGASRRSSTARSDDGRDPGGRFTATTPRFQRPPEFNTDCPSGYGWWPYARAAAKTGGAYLVYPFPPKPWADDCPRYEPLMDALAPETCSADDLATRLRRDPVVAILARAQSIVFEATPWSDAGGRGGAAASAPGDVHGDASSWFGLEMRGPVVPAKRWITRDVPVDEVGAQRGVAQWQRYGAELLRTAERYDEASDVLDAAVADLAAGKLAAASRRSQANLRLARFWNAMSAFHLRALSVYLADIDRRMPDPPPREILITYLPAVRLSDCLDAYVERTISWDQEQSYGWIAPYREKGGQGNFLRAPLDDANYRARRDLDCALLRLDPRLVGPALRVVAAAADVMRHEAKSPWGWTTYYSELHTFIWEAVPDRTGPTPQYGPQPKQPKGPKTPKDTPAPPPPPATPGSGSGGAPSTGK